MDKPTCPYCGGQIRIGVCDDEGNPRDESYAENPWSGIGYQLLHSDRDVPNWTHCPLSTEDDSEPFGRWKYDTRDEALSAAMQRYVEPNRVLTLDELDGMNGDPVFIQGGDGEEFWIIADKDWMYEIDYDPDFINMEYNDPVGHFGLHVLGWRALLRRPTDEERQAAGWEGEHA